MAHRRHHLCDPGIDDDALRHRMPARQRRHGDRRHVRSLRIIAAERQKELEKIQIVHNRAHLIQKYNRAVLTPEEIEKMKDVIHRRW